MPDPVYQQWLRINHPTIKVQNELHRLPNEVISPTCEAVGDQAKAHQKKSDKSDSLNSAAVHQEGQVACSTQKLLGISPEQERSFQRTFKDSCFMQWLKMRSPAEYAGVTADHDLGLEHSTNITPCIITNDNRSQLSANELTSCQESQLNSSVLQGVTSPEHDGELNYISKYLIQYVPTKKTVNNGKRTTGARVLTSDECAKIIFEREEKKRKEQEEKEARKAERELKKKEREEAAKKKAEETARKKEEAAKKKEEAARKKAEAAR